MLLLVVIITPIISCTDPPSYRIGDSDYFIVEGDWKDYVGYCEDEDMYLNVYFPHSDTIIKEVRWDNKNIYVILSDSNNIIGMLIIRKDIEVHHQTAEIYDTSLISNNTILGRKKISTFNNRWLGKI